MAKHQIFRLNSFIFPFFLLTLHLICKVTRHEESILVDIGHPVKSRSAFSDIDVAALFPSRTELGGR